MLAVLAMRSSAAVWQAVVLFGHTASAMHLPASMRGAGDMVFGEGPATRQRCFCTRYSGRAYVSIVNVLTDVHVVTERNQITHPDACCLYCIILLPLQAAV
jgi:hypothetical protein